MKGKRQINKRLSEEQVERYEQEGVLFPLEVLSAAEVLKFRSAFEQMESRLGTPLKPIQLAQSHLFLRWAYELVTHPSVLDIVEDIIGPDILVHSTTIFPKYPRDESYVSWHQDGYYWQLDKPSLASAWIALTDSNIENGCLRVVPGTHTSRIEHVSRPAKENLLTTGLEVAVDVDESTVSDIILRAGEMSLHHVNMVHGSNPNHSDTRRIGFAVRYVAPHVKQARPHHDVLLARGHDDSRHFTIGQPPPPDNSPDESLEAFVKFRRLEVEKALRNAGEAGE